MLQQNDFINKNSSKINADSFNVTAGDDFVNKDSATINAATVTIEVTNFADDILPILEPFHQIV